MIIAIDGPTAAGKGTIAVGLARYFGLAFLDTGRLYRATALVLLENNMNSDSEDDAERAALSLQNANLYELTEKKAIRDEKTGMLASKISAMPGVRKALFDVQRNFAVSPYLRDGSKAKGAVLDGRDIGSVICPDADVKFFVTAKSEIRAERRFKELQEKGKSVTYEQVLEDLIKRDEQDEKRQQAPLKPAKDAIILDNSSLDISSATAEAIRLADERIGKKLFG
jgi:cytidylate kinase